MGIWRDTDGDLDDKRADNERASDERAVRAALDRGEYRKAIELLAKPYTAESLRRFCIWYFRLGDEDAEDVVQVVFEQAFKDIPAFKGNVSPRDWLFGIARHRCMDHLRRSRRESGRFTLMDEDCENQAPDSDVWSRVDGVLDKPTDLRLLRTLLQRLDEKVAFAIVLRYIEGFTYPEMAEFCGEPIDTLRQRVNRGFAQLQEHGHLSRSFRLRPPWHRPRSSS